MSDKHEAYQVKSITEAFKQAGYEQIESLNSSCSGIRFRKPKSITISCLFYTYNTDNAFVLEQAFNHTTQRWVNIYKAKGLPEGLPTYWTILKTQYKESVSQIEDSLKSFLPLNITKDDKRTILHKKSQIGLPKSYKNVKTYSINKKILISKLPIKIKFIGFKQILEENGRIKITDKGLESPNADPWILLELTYLKSTGPLGFANSYYTSTIQRCILTRISKYHIIKKRGVTYCFPKIGDAYELCQGEKDMIDKLTKDVLCKS